MSHSLSEENQAEFINIVKGVQIRKVLVMAGQFDCKNRKKGILTIKLRNSSFPQNEKNALNSHRQLWRDKIFVFGGISKY